MIGPKFDPGHGRARCGGRRGRSGLARGGRARRGARLHDAAPHLRAERRLRDVRPEVPEDDDRVARRAVERLLEEVAVDPDLPEVERHLEPDRRVRRGGERLGEGVPDARPGPERRRRDREVPRLVAERDALVERRLDGGPRLLLGQSADGDAADRHAGRDRRRRIGLRQRRGSRREGEQGRDEGDPAHGRRIVPTEAAHENTPGSSVMTASTPSASTRASAARSFTVQARTGAPSSRQRRTTAVETTRWWSVAASACAPRRNGADPVRKRAAQEREPGPHGGVGQSLGDARAVVRKRARRAEARLERARSRGARPGRTTRGASAPRARAGAARRRPRARLPSTSGRGRGARSPRRARRARRRGRACPRRPRPRSGPRGAARRRRARRARSRRDPGASAASIPASEFAGASAAAPRWPIRSGPPSARRGSQSPLTGSGRSGAASRRARRRATRSPRSSGP